MRLLDWVFDDKRVAAAVLMLWLVGVVGTLQVSMDIFHSDFISFGPSPHMRFMTVTIDTWEQWGLLAVATFCNTCMSDFMSDAIAPWYVNTIQDHKTKYLPYSKFTCYTITQAWSVYCNVMSIFGVALMMSQIDMLMIRLLADLMVNTFTCFKFMKNKRTDHRRYWLWTEDPLSRINASVEMDQPILDVRAEEAGT